MRVTNCAGERSFSRLKLMEKKSASQRKNEAAAFVISQVFNTNICEISLQRIAL
jgi:hypothetical protein